MNVNFLINNVNNSLPSIHLPKKSHNFGALGTKKGYNVANNIDVQCTRSC